MTNEELLEAYNTAVDAAMHRAKERDGFASNISRESRVAGLRAIERQAAEEALLKAAASFEATDHAWGKLAMIEHLRARAAAYRREETE